MRHGLLALGIALGIAVLVGFVRVYEHTPHAALSEEERLAIDVGCRGHKGQAAQECRSVLKRLYRAGSLDPDRTLRSYCESMKDARWAGSPPAPPKVCVDRYGGWKGG